MSPMRLFALFLALASGPALAGPADLDVRFDGDGRTARDFASGEFSRLRAMPALAGDATGLQAVVSRPVGDDMRSYLVRFDDRGNELPGALDLNVPGEELNLVRFDAQGRSYVIRRYNEEFGHRLQLRRRLPGGAPDLAFGGGDGEVTMGLNEYHLYAQDLAFDALGAFAVVASAQPLATATEQKVFTVVQLFEADGSSRSSFDGDGRAVHDLVPVVDDHPAAVALTGSGSVLVCHWAEFAGQRDALLTRLRAGGAVDTTYGSSGTLYVDTSPSGGPDRNDYCDDVGLQPGTGATFMAVSGSGTSVTSGRGRLVPVSAQGVEGSSYDTIAGDYPVLALAFDAAGRPLLAGAVNGYTPTPTIALVCYTTTGVPDIAFGVGGVASYPLPVTATMQPESAMPFAIGVATDARGRILIGGDMTDSITFGSAWYALRVGGDALLVDGFE